MATKKRPVSLELAMQGADVTAEPHIEAPPRSLVPEVEKLTVYVPRAAAKRLKQSWPAIGEHLNALPAAGKNTFDER